MKMSIEQGWAKNVLTIANNDDDSIHYLGFYGRSLETLCSQSVNANLQLADVCMF